MITDFIQKISTWYFSKRSLPYWCIFLVDCGIVFLSALITCIINYGAAHTLSQFGSFATAIAFYLLFYILGFRLFHTYSGIIRYSSFVDLEYVGAAVLFGFGCSTIYTLAFDSNSMIVEFRVRDIFVWSIISVLLMWGIRVLVKILYDTMYRQNNATPIFIYGVKEGGIGLAKSIKNQGQSEYVLKGFVSDFPDIVGHTLMGTKVYSHDDYIGKMVKMGIKTLFVSPLRSASFREDQEMVNRLLDNAIKIYMMPKAQEWDGKEKIDHKYLKEVEVEDLLPRDKIEVDMEAIGKLLNKKRILITGAAGSIGSEIVRQVALFNPAELVLIDQAETPMHDIRLMMKREYSHVKAQTIVADITNKIRMEEIFSDNRPDYVFHAAAYKHVPMMEDNPAESVRNNVEGTRIIANLAVKYNTKKFVMISTDKAVNPTNVMGCSKRICEMYVQSLDKAEKEGNVEGMTQFVTTRFGNVLGSNGSVIPLFKEQIKNGGPITVTHPDIIRFFMLIPEACKLVLEAGTMGKGGEIFVFDMGKPVKIVDLAKRMIQLSHAEGVKIKFTGLRDGEKLYEEVLNEKETTLPTIHPKIKVAKVREYEYAVINAQIDKLVESGNTATDMEIVKVMKEIVPEFKSQHSVYEKLDK